MANAEKAAQELEKATSPQAIALKMAEDYERAYYSAGPDKTEKCGAAILARDAWRDVGDQSKHKLFSESVEVYCH